MQSQVMTILILYLFSFLIIAQLESQSVKLAECQLALQQAKGESEAFKHQLDGMYVQLQQVPTQLAACDPH